MERRNFLKALGIGGAACALVPVAAVTKEAGASALIGRATQGCTKVLGNTEEPFNIDKKLQEAGNSPSFQPLDSAPMASHPYYMSGEEALILSKLGGVSKYSVCWRIMMTYPECDSYETEDGWIPICVFDTEDEAEAAAESLDESAWHRYTCDVFRYYEHMDWDVDEVLAPSWKEMSVKQRLGLFEPTDMFEEDVVYNKPPLVCDYPIDTPGQLRRLEYREACEIFARHRSEYEKVYLDGSETPLVGTAYSLLALTLDGRIDKDVIEILRKHSDFSFFTIKRIGVVDGSSVRDIRVQPTDSEVGGVQA